MFTLDDGFGLTEPGDGYGIGGAEIRIVIPDSVIATCTQRNGVVSTECLQRFCSEQQAGTATTPDVGSQQFACQSTS